MLISSSCFDFGIPFYKAICYSTGKELEELSMEYITAQDYHYIMNKYHRQDKPFDPHKRWIRQDDIFDEETGMQGDLLIAGILEQDQALVGLPRPVRKAKAFAFVLKNTRITCDKRDIFPAINAIDRPLNSSVVAAWRKEVFCEIIPEVETKRSHFEKSGIATIWPDYDHSVPVWDRIFALGFRGLLEESEKARNAYSNLTSEQTAFFDGVQITYTAILDFIKRLEQQAIKDENSRLADALASIYVQPPKTFYEALLVDYLYFMLSEHIEGLQVRSLSNFDRLFYSYYQNDLANGITQEQIRKDLAYFFLQFTAIGNYWNQPVFLGGCKADESTEINELSYLFLDVYDKMGIYNPKIQIKVAASTPKDFLLKALDMIRRGHSSIVFVSDATIRKALENAGISPEDARLCNVKGCYEYSIQGAMNTGMNYVNLLKPLEYALHEGCDGTNGNFVGLKSPHPNSFDSFDEFFREYKKQLAYVIGQVMQIVNSFEPYLSYINPQSMLSATYPACLETAKDALGGGATRNGCGMCFGFMADIADSLAALKKYVFDQKLLNLGEFTDILDKDFAGYELFRQKLLRDRDKYGNNKDLPDSIAKEIVDFICKAVCGKPGVKGNQDTWNIGFHVARMSYIQAPLTASSPNGRLKGEELSKNISASMGMNQEGATAAILSITKIDATKFTSDACLDLGLLPAAVKGAEGLDAMYGLLMTFVRRGGHALHINVFQADTLRDAQAHPEKYQDLQIRVCGWNVLWNNISKEEQDGFIRQAENLV